MAELSEERQREIEARGNDEQRELVRGYRERGYWRLEFERATMERNLALSEAVDLRARLEAAERVVELTRGPWRHGLGCRETHPCNQCEAIAAYDAARAASPAKEE